MEARRRQNTGRGPEAPRFQRLVRTALVEAGATTTADFALRVGEVTESVTVDAASPQMHYDSHTVGGVVTHSQIEDLPLNGRSFLELAKLEPGVQPPSRTSSNRVFVPVLGVPAGITAGGPGSRSTAAATPPENYEEFRVHPLASWIESTFGVRAEHGSERLVRPV